MEKIPGFSLRPATPEDLPLLFKASTEAMKPVTQELNPEKDFNEDEELAKYKEKFDPEKIQVIRYGDQDVGRLRIVRSEESIYVGGIQILPEFQGKGIGTDIFTELIEEANKTGLPIVLEVHDVNEKALAFYEKLGFVKGAQIKNQTIMTFTPVHSNT